jgi:hypothetical protein
MSEHDWHRPDGLTYQECRVCGFLKGTDSENKARPCEPDKYRKPTLISVKPILVDKGKVLPGDFAVPDVSLRLRCSACGSRNVKTQPDWKEGGWARLEMPLPVTSPPRSIM